MKQAGRKASHLISNVSADLRKGQVFPPGRAACSRFSMTQVIHLDVSGAAHNLWTDPKSLMVLACRPRSGRPWTHDLRDVARQDTNAYGRRIDAPGP